MSVCLVSYVPYNPVVRRIENIMAGYGNFDCAKARCEVSWINSYFLNYVLAKFVAWSW